MAFYRVPTEFFVGDSMRSQGAFTALTLRALRCHGVRTAKKSMKISGTVAIRI